MKFLSIYLILLLSVLFSDGKLIPDGFIERIETAERTENSIVDWTLIKLVRIRGGNKIQGTTQILVDFDDNVEMEVLVYKLQGNEYRLTPFKIPRKKFCDFYNVERPLNTEYYEAFKFPDECPIKKGNYSGELEMTFKTVPPNFDGKYKVHVKYYYKKNYVDSNIGYGEIHHYIA